MAQPRAVTRVEVMIATHRPRALVALAGAAVLALSACGGDGSGEDSSSSTTASADSSSASSPASPSESGSASETPSASGSGSEEGGEGTATATKAGVSFDVPDGWTVVDPAKIADGSQEAPQALEDSAKRQGTTAKQLVAQVAQSVDVMVIGDTEGGFGNNVNVVASPAMPTKSDMTSQLQQIGAEVGEVEETDTELGSALDSSYTMGQGSQQFHARMLAVPTDSGAAMITVSAGSEGTADEVATSIIDSVTAS